MSAHYRPAFVSLLAVYALTLYLLVVVDMGAVKQYTVPINSPLNNVYGTTEAGVVPNPNFGIANDQIRHNIARLDGKDPTATDADCGSSYVPLAVKAASEKFFIKQTSQNMWLYDCRSAADSDADDDDSSNNEYSHCPRFEIDRSELHKGRFKQDRVQRLLQCPPQPDEAQDCPADDNGYEGLSDMSTEIDFQDCQTPRTDRECTKKIKFTEDQYITSSIVIVFSYVLGMGLYSAKLPEDRKTLKDTNALTYLGFGLLLVGHLVALVLGSVYLSHTSAINDLNGNCIGEYVEATLGAQLEADDVSSSQIFVIIQITATAVGAIVLFFDLKQFQFESIKGSIADVGKADDNN